MFEPRITKAWPLAVALLVISGAQGGKGATAAEPVAHPMGFFVTSKTPVGSGALGGLKGADKICQDLAASVGAGGRTWRAYLSTQTNADAVGENARDRIGKGPWYNAKNVLIAASVADLHGDIERDRNNIQRSSVLTEKGELPPLEGDMANKHDILTGSDSHGRAFPRGLDTTCENWTSDAPEHHAMVGHYDRSGGGNTSWNSTHLSVACSAEKLFANGYPGRLYCFAAD